VSIVAFILGVLIVVQLRSQAGDNGLAQRSAQDLTLLVANLNTRNDQLRTEVDSLERQLQPLELGGRSGTSSLIQIRDDLARVRAWAGLDAVAGRGVAITISGSIAGPALEDLINELRNAGAEAIAIEDVRVVGATVVFGSAGGLSVDDTALHNPFVVRAIGNWGAKWAFGDPDPAELDGGAPVLVAAHAALAELEPFTAEAIETALRAVLERLGLKPRQGFQPIRVAVTGSKISPGLFESIELLGRETTLARLNAGAA
jgi:cell division protein FtsB